MANSESEFEDATRNDDQISEKELDCNLCEKDSKTNQVKTAHNEMYHGKRF